MADILPPAPINEPPKSYAWVEWYKNLREFINNTASNIPWISINKAGANLTDIPTRLHNSLQSIQGGTTNQYYHLTATEHTDVLAIIAGGGGGGSGGNVDGGNAGSVYGGTPLIDGGNA
jgi:hypothetical protein